MAIWDKLKTELDRAGKAAQNALDEGKVRLEAFRTRQLADKAAQALGYAVYRAKQAGADLDPESYERLSTTLGTHEAEAARLEQQLRDLGETSTEKRAEPPPASSSPPPPAAEAAPPPEAPAV
jgi:negative regulator of sigma E activity